MNIKFKREKKKLINIWSCVKHYYILKNKGKHYKRKVKRLAVSAHVLAQWDQIKTVVKEIFQN